MGASSGRTEPWPWSHPGRKRIRLSTAQRYLDGRRRTDGSARRRSTFFRADCRRKSTMTIRRMSPPDHRTIHHVVIAKAADGQRIRAAGRLAFGPPVGAAGQFATGCLHEKSRPETAQEGTLVRPANPRRAASYR